MEIVISPLPFGSLPWLWQYAVTGIVLLAKAFVFGIMCKKAQMAFRQNKRQAGVTVRTKTYILQVAGTE